MRDSGIGMPSLSMMAWNWSRSSAASMESTDVPSTLQPASLRPRARLSGVWPPNWTMTPSGFSAS